MVERSSRNEETICIQSEESEIANLETEMAELVETTRKLNEDLEKAKYEVMVRQKEASIIKYLRDSINDRIGQTKKKNVEEV